MTASAVEGLRLFPPVDEPLEPLLKDIRLAASRHFGRRRKCRSCERLSIYSWPINGNPMDN